ncbi:hypothetical protein [Verrucosispora sp. NA02020]|uniref:hypothetical protein n=1 Tax=Verrucosispora sp. NA02020 TaxID=2742132 RepID=UPI003D750199
MTGVIDELAPRLVDGAIDTYVVEVQASGVMHRLLKGGPLRSPLTQFLSGQSVLTAWLPLEDSATTTDPTRGAPGQPRATAAAVEWGQRDEGMPGSLSVARLESAAARIVMPVPTVEQIGVGGQILATVGWYWRAFTTLGSTPIDIAVISVRSEQVSRLVIRANETGLTTVAQDSAGATVHSLFAPWSVAHPSEGWVGIRIQLERPDLLPALRLHASLHAVGSLQWMNYASTLGSFPWGHDGFSQVETVWAGGSGWSQLYAVNLTTAPPQTIWPASGYVREPAANRLVRACATAGVQLAPVGATGTSMGPQPPGTLMAVMRDVEDADGGTLFEGRDGRFAYLPRVSRYNQPTALPLTYSQLAPPLAPTDDDRYVRNDWTVSRTGGGSAQFVDDAHVAEFGRYDESAAINLSSDNRLRDRAAWRVHLGTVDDLRYPVLSVNFRRPATTPAIAAWLACDIGSRMTVTGVPEAMGPGVIDQIIEGYTETIDKYEWRAEINTSPASPWGVFVVGDQARGRLDTAGSELATSALVASTDLLVATDPGRKRWITSSERPQDFPMFVWVGPEVVQVDAITDTSSPQLFSVTRAVNGIAIEHPAGTRVRVARWGV